MKISVVIPVYNEEKYIQACLSHIFNQEEIPDEVIVVDNNSIDRSVDIAKKFPVRIVKEIKQGMIQARNKGFNSATYSVIARTDADTYVSKDWIKKIKLHFKNRKLMALSGSIHLYSIPEVLQAPHWPPAVFIKSFRQTCGHDPLFGPNMAIRKSVWQMVKNEVCLDDKQVHEDYDLTLHISKYGEIMFDKSLVVSSSLRRWKKLKPYFEYPLRTIRTIRNHRELLIARSHTRRIFRSLAYTTINE